jgi:hypothetical protein
MPNEHTLRCTAQLGVGGAVLVGPVFSSSLAAAGDDGELRIRRKMYILSLSNL